MSDDRLDDFSEKYTEWIKNKDKKEKKKIIESHIDKENFELLSDGDKQQILWLSFLENPFEWGDIKK